MFALSNARHCWKCHTSHVIAPQTWGWDGYGKFGRCGEEVGWVLVAGILRGALVCLFEPGWSWVTFVQLCRSCQLRIWFGGWGSAMACGGKPKPVTYDAVAQLLNELPCWSGGGDLQVPWQSQLKHQKLLSFVCDFLAFWLMGRGE